MAKAVFAYDNLAAAEGVVITVNNPLASHPLSRLIDGMIGLRCWIDGSAGEIYVDMGDTYNYGLRPWSQVALVGTNLPPDVTVTLEATNDPSWSVVEYGKVEIPASPTSRQNNRWLLLEADRLERFLRITVGSSAILADEEDTVLPGGVPGGTVISNVQIGQLLIASPLRLERNFSQNYAINASLGVLGQRTSYGVARFYQTHGVVETWQLPFSHYPRQAWEKLVNMWQTLQGPCRPLLFIPDPDDVSRMAFWCRAAEALQTQFDYWQLHDMGSLTLPLVEEPMPEEIEEVSA